jgi:hypothetical protein
MNAKIGHVRQLYRIALILLLVLFVANCGVPTEPRPLAEAFIASMQAMDFSSAQSMVVPESRDRLRFIQSIASALPKDEGAIITGFPAGTLDIRSVTIADSSATVVYVIGANVPETLILTQTSAGWRVRFEAKNLYP